MLRINGELHRVDFPPMESDDLRTMLYEITPEYKIKVFEESGDVDFGYEIPNVSRFRANFFNQKNGVSAVFRQIPSQVLSFEDFEKFDAPLPPVLKKLCMLKKGMVLVTGPTGSGKSTTLAAMLDYANKNRKDHILTVEDPIEFVHESKSSLINHREVGIHTKSFASALKGALREDPDIILVGEMRDLETIELEILIFTNAIANLVREGKTHQIPGMIQVGKKLGNQPLDDAIMDHLKMRRISPEEAYEKCLDRKKFRPFLANPPLDDDA
jgi:twitching motility protein PilT